MKTAKHHCLFCKQASARKYHQGCMVRINRRAVRGRSVTIPRDAVISAIINA